MNRNRPAAGNQPDEELVRRSRAGDGSAFGVLVERHHGAAFSLAVGMVRDHHLAEDAVQEACMRAWKAITNFRGDASFRTWLLSIVANQAREGLRLAARRRESSVSEAHDLPSREVAPDHRAVVSADAERVRALLDRLPEKQRLSVTLRIDAGLSFREIGELTGSSEGGARVNYHYGIRRLRREMGEEGS